MNKTLSTTLIVLAVLILAGGIFFAGSMYARMNTYGPGSMIFSRGWNNENSYRPNMMNGRGSPDMMGRNGNNNGYGPGRMNSNGGMMGGFGYNDATLTPLTVEQAKAGAEKYLANLNNSDLQITEVMIFDNNAYIVVKEVSTGNGAFELLADSSSQVAYPEHGPNMMWNLKYGSANHTNMMGGDGGMMGGRNSQNTTPADVSAEMTVTSEKAIEIAQKYLDTNIAGATAANDPIKFYGYYTLDYEINGKVAGMLSVNGYSGDVFLHTWHGIFIEEAMVK